MSTTEQIISRIRRFATSEGLRPTAYANRAGIAESCTRKMFERRWNPTLKTLTKMESVIPPDWQPGDVASNNTSTRPAPANSAQAEEDCA